MLPQAFVDTLFLLGAAVVAIGLLARLRLPTVLGYLLIGLAFGPHTGGPVIHAGDYTRFIAEIGIVFLLFTIGLSFTLTQIYAQRHLVLGLGTAQVALTTLVVGLACWLAGLSPVVSFVIGAVFAQSSSTIISKQLVEQGEEQTRHGRLGLSMSVFQDVTAVPFLVVIPVLGAGLGGGLAAPLGLALAKAALAFLLIIPIGRWLLRPLFHEVAARRSPELFTLTVLFVSLMAGGITSLLGLSMAFGAFLAGMMLGETEFRHQIEATIRPFRDVLLGLFFITIGMLFDPALLPTIWPWALAGTAVLLGGKALVVAVIVRLAGLDMVMAWRTAIVLSVGGEFGFALLAIAGESGAIAGEAGQVALISVLLSMFIAPFLMRYNKAIALRLAGRRAARHPDAPPARLPDATALRDHVVVCGYGRIGQSVGNFLEEEGIPYVALDLDVALVRDAHAAGKPVYFGDAADIGTLDAVNLAGARLLVLAHDDVGAALKTLEHVRGHGLGLPVMVRTRDETHVGRLREAGATEVVPETLEAGMMLVSHVLLTLDVPMEKVMQRMGETRAGRYQMLRAYFIGDNPDAAGTPVADARMHAVAVPPEAPAVGRPLAELALGPSLVALLRHGVRHEPPPADAVLAGGDVLVLFAPPSRLEQIEKSLVREEPVTPAPSAA